MERWGFVLLGSMALDLCLAGAALLPWRWRAVMPFATLAWLAKTAAYYYLTRNFFGLLHLVYLDLVVVLPLAATLFLLVTRRRQTVRWWARVLAGCALLLAPVGVYATFIEPFRLQVETAHAPLPAPRSGTQPLRVGILADIQTPRVTAYEHAAVDRLLALEPDVILIAGDFLQGAWWSGEIEQEIPAMRALLTRLNAPGGVYAVLGDTDTHERVGRIVEGTRVRLLVNEFAQARIGDREVTVGGLEVNFRSAEARATMARLESEPGDGDVRILLAHRPDAALRLTPATRVDLTVAGHTHGGQVVVPFFGPPITLSGVPRTAAAGGLHDIGGGRLLYVSRGIGLERGHAPQVRFLAPPDVSLVVLGE